MKYLTGPICFGIPCGGTSKGTWLYTKADFTNPDMLKFAESEDSPFKDFQIETDKIIPYHEDEELFNVATHVRAYLDMLWDCDFEHLKGAYDEYIDSYTCRDVIFHEVVDRINKTEKWDAVKQFMCDEFGSHWKSFYFNWREMKRRINAKQVST